MEEKNVIEETVSAETEETTETAEAVQEADSKEMKELKEQLEKAEAERVATNDKYLRMMAEYDNYRKRSTKEKENAYAEAFCDAIGAIGVFGPSRMDYSKVISTVEYLSNSLAGDRVIGLLGEPTDKD